LSDDRNLRNISIGTIHKVKWIVENVWTFKTGKMQKIAADIKRYKIKRREIKSSV